MTIAEEAVLRPPEPSRRRAASSISLAGRADTRRWLVAGLLILIAAFAIRGGEFGNPMIDVDEDYYLLVGDRMLHGSLPYVDIWDRKPVGLFLIYAAIRLLGGIGIVQYQVVATLFAAATAFVVTRIAARMAPMPAAVGAGSIYLLMLQLAGGMGGQSPVFYNLFMACAAMLTLRVAPAVPLNPALVRRVGVAAMLLTGVAMQIKYNALFEGVFFGLVLLFAGWRARGGVSVALVADAALWIGCAILPTAAAFACYAWIGHADAFVYANFLSIGGRSAEAGSVLLDRLLHSWNALQLPIFCVLLSILLEPWRAFRQGPETFRFVIAWLGAALFGYFLFGTFFDHYALPLMLPIAVACAPAFGYRRHGIGLCIMAFLLVAGTVASVVRVSANLRKTGGEAAVARMLAVIRPRLHDGFYMYDGNTILYYLTGAPLPTRWPFPQHIGLQREAGALGVDPLAELRRILTKRPGLILDSIDEDESEENPAANAILRAEVARDYRAIAKVPHKGGVTVIYERLGAR